MNIILAGLGKILLQLSAAFVVLGVAYLLLFAPPPDGPLSPELVAENLAPIGRVQITEPPAPIPTPPQTPPATSAASSAPAETPTPIAATAAAEPAVVAEPEPEPEPTILEAPTTAATEAPIPAAGPAPNPAPDPESLQIPSTVPESTPSASRPAPTADAPAAVSIRLAPDGNGMHGSYRLTPEGIVLYPASLIGPDTQLFLSAPIKGSFWATPSGVAHFRLQPTAPVD